MIFTEYKAYGLMEQRARTSLRAGRRFPQGATVIRGQGRGAGSSGQRIGMREERTGPSACRTHTHITMTHVLTLRAETAAFVGTLGHASRQFGRVTRGVRTKAQGAKGNSRGTGSSRMGGIFTHYVSAKELTAKNYKQLLHLDDKSRL